MKLPPPPARGFQRLEVQSISLCVKEFSFFAELGVRGTPSILPILDTLILQRRSFNTPAWKSGGGGRVSLVPGKWWVLLLPSRGTRRKWVHSIPIPPRLWGSSTIALKREGGGIPLLMWKRKGGGYHSRLEIFLLEQAFAEWGAGLAPNSRQRGD